MCWISGMVLFAVTRVCRWFSSRLTLFRFSEHVAEMGRYCIARYFLGQLLEFYSRFCWVELGSDSLRFDLTPCWFVSSLIRLIRVRHDSKAKLIRLIRNRHDSKADLIHLIRIRPGSSHVVRAFRFVKFEFDLIRQVLDSIRFGSLGSWTTLPRMLFQLAKSKLVKCNRASRHISFKWSKRLTRGIVPPYIRVYIYTIYGTCIRYIPYMYTPCIRYIPYMYTPCTVYMYHIYHMYTLYTPAQLLSLNVHMCWLSEQSVQK